MAVGNIGTGKGSTVRIKEEYSFATQGTSTYVDLRRLTHGFGKNPLFVESGHAATTELGQVKETVHSAQGSIDFEVDATSIGWPLKWVMNSTVSSSQQGGTSEYKHTFRFGNAPKTIQVYENKGGLSTPYYRKYLGMYSTNLSINLDMSGTLRGGLDVIGQTSDTGSDPGTASPAAQNLTFAYGDISYYYGSAGDTTIAAMSAWTPPFDFEMNIMRLNASNQNYNSDGTGKPTGIYEGEPGVLLKLATELNTNHKMADFEAGTEVAFGLRLDTGVAVPSGTGGNYKLDFIFPRVRLEEYQVRATTRGRMIAVVPLKVMTDPTATYSVSAELYNATTSYPNATA